jgi:hypothetical protein
MYPTTCKYSHAWQDYRVFEQIFDGSVHPKNLVKLFECLSVQR